MRASNTISLLILFAAVAIAVALSYEGFTSPGTMDQLASTHVTTEEDVHYYNVVYPKQLRREITTMTGGDPGKLRPMSFPLGGYYTL